jgi:putative cell wall-binding protein
VRRDSVPESTREFLDDNGIEAVVVAGGTGVVNEAVADEIGCERRLAGANRYLTAIEVAKYGIDELGMNQRVIGLASGTSFADALAAGPYLGSGRRALLLTDGSLLAPATKSFLGSRKGVFARVIAIGGTSAVSEAAFQEAVNVIR